VSSVTKVGRVFAVAAIAVVALALVVVAAPVVDAARVVAQKVVPNQVHIIRQYAQYNPNCNDLHGSINAPMTCGTATVTGNVQIVSGGSLTVGGSGRGNYNLNFTSGYTLEVMSGGALTVTGTNVFNTGAHYSFIADDGSTIYLESTDIWGAAKFEIAANLATLKDVYCYDNDEGLIISGSGNLVTESKFYNNNAFGIKLIGHAKYANVIEKSEFYASSGTQDVGIFLQDASGNFIGDRKALGGGNYIRGNGKAGILSNDSQGNEIMYNRIEQNGGAGVIEYNTVNGIGGVQAWHIKNNDGYGLVTIDSNGNAGIENSVGTNGLGKAATLYSMRVGGWLYQAGQPDHPVYVENCNGDLLHCQGATSNEAYHYDDYTLQYTRVSEFPEFTSDLTATDHTTIYSWNGENWAQHEALWTPKFLVRQYIVTNSGQTVNACGNPNQCSVRAVTIYDGQKWGNSIDYQNPQDYQYIYDLMEGGGLLNANKKQAQKITPIVQSDGRRPAVKVSSVPVLNAVTTPPHLIPAQRATS